jgi:hypothetical protein
MILVGFFVFVSILIYILFFMRSKVSVEVTPTSAIVTLDNQPAQVINGSASFITSLGHHTLRVEADNYVGFKEEINLTRGRNFSKKISLAEAPSPVRIADSASHIAIYGNKVFYQNLSDDLFYQATLNYDSAGNASVASSQQITSAPIDPSSQIIWSPDKSLLLIKNGTTVNLLNFKNYNFVGQNQVLFGNDIGDIAWSPDNSRVAYYYAPATGERSLIFADSQNQNITRVANLAELNISNPYIAFSPDSQWLVIIPRNSDAAENKIYLMNVYTKVISTVVNSGNQEEAVFTSDSSKIIYSTYSPNLSDPIHQVLSVVNLDGSNNKSLGVAGQASSVRLWTNTNEVFLPSDEARSKMILVNLNSGQTSDFYFTGQGNSLLSEAYLNDSKNGAIFVSNQTLYFVKLEGNG